MGNFGHIYAANSDGTLRWVVSPAGGVSGCLGMLKDGNLVVGGGGGVQALSYVDGSTVWTFPLQTPLVAGPSVGPDGKSTQSTTAAGRNQLSERSFSPRMGIDLERRQILSPRRWMDGSGGEVWGNNAYFWSDYSSTGDPDVLGGLNAIHIGGGLNWRVTDGVGICRMLAPMATSRSSGPRASKCGNANGGMIWSQNLDHFGGQPQVEAVVASDGRTYFTTTAAKLHAISPTGQILYSR